jgi:DNA-binding response OmpR family regulator
MIRRFDPNTPVLFYSAAAYAHDKQAAFSAGAQAYLVKPVRFDELMRAVARLTSIPTETAFEARRAELAAILEELNIRQAANAEGLIRLKRNISAPKRKYLETGRRLPFLRPEAQGASSRANGRRCY